MLPFKFFSKKRVEKKKQLHFEIVLSPHTGTIQVHRLLSLKIQQDSSRCVPPRGTESSNLIERLEERTANEI
jgi:hypothetical protein